MLSEILPMTMFPFLIDSFFPALGEPALNLVVLDPHSAPPSETTVAIARSFFVCTILAMGISVELRERDDEGVQLTANVSAEGMSSVEEDADVDDAARLAIASCVHGQPFKTK